MSKELNCMNCCIGDFKHSLCDCNNGMCKEYKRAGKAEDFENEVLKRTKPKTGWIPVSEKPKDEKKVYLVQLDSGGMCSCRWTNANPLWTGWHWNRMDIPWYSDIVAWMDLEPYREDGEA